MKPFDQALQRTDVPRRVGDAWVRFDDPLVVVERRLEATASWRPLVLFVTSATVACVAVALVLFTEATSAPAFGLLLAASGLAWHRLEQRRPWRQVCVFHLERQTLRVDTVSTLGRRTLEADFATLRAVELDGEQVVCRSDAASWVIASAIASEERDTALRLARVLSSVVGLSAEHEPSAASSFEA